MNESHTTPALFLSLSAERKKQTHVERVQCDAFRFQPISLLNHMIFFSSSREPCCVHGCVCMWLCSCVSMESIFVLIRIICDCVCVLSSRDRKWEKENRLVYTSYRRKVSNYSRLMPYRRVFLYISLVVKRRVFRWKMCTAKDRDGNIYWKTIYAHRFPSFSDSDIFPHVYA